MSRIIYALLLVYAFLLPFERIWRILINSDTVFKPYRIVGIFVALLLFSHRLFAGKKLKLDGVDKAYAGLFAWGTVMAFFWNVIETNDIGHTTHNLQLCLFALMMLVVVKNVAKDFRAVSRLVFAYIAGVFVSATWAFFMPDELTGRFRGLQNNPNQLGMSAGWSFVFLFGQYVFTRRASMLSQALKVTFAALLLALIGLSGSRTAAFGTLAGVAVLLLLALLPRKGERSGPSYLTRVGGFTLLLVLMAVTQFARFESTWEQTDSRSRFDRDYTAQTAGERWDVWQASFNVGVDHYGLGAGLMQYLSHHKQAIKEVREKANDNVEDHVLGTHSDYLDLFACYGLVGIGLFLFVVRGFVSGLWIRLTAASSADDGTFVAAGILVTTLAFEGTANCFAWCDYFLMISMVNIVVATHPSHRPAWLQPKRPLPSLPKELPT